MLLPGIVYALVTARERQAAALRQQRPRAAGTITGTANVERRQLFLTRRHRPAGSRCHFRRTAAGSIGALRRMRGAPAAVPHCGNGTATASSISCHIAPLTCSSGFWPQDGNIHLFGTAEAVGWATAAPSPVYTSGYSNYLLEDSADASLHLSHGQPRLRQSLAPYQKPFQVFATDDRTKLGLFRPHSPSGQSRGTFMYKMQFSGWP